MRQTLQAPARFGGLPGSGFVEGVLVVGGGFSLAADDSVFVASVSGIKEGRGFIIVTGRIKIYILEYLTHKREKPHPVAYISLKVSITGF